MAQNSIRFSFALENLTEAEARWLDITMRALNTCQTQADHDRAVADLVEEPAPADHSGKTSWLNLLAAISQYFSSISIPMAFRPRSLAARRVVPEPMKGSRIVPPIDNPSISHCKSFVGFGDGCPKPLL